MEQFDFIFLKLSDPTNFFMRFVVGFEKVLYVLQRPTGIYIFTSCGIPQFVLMVGCLKIVGTISCICHSHPHQFLISEICVQKNVVIK